MPTFTIRWPLMTMGLIITLAILLAAACTGGGEPTPVQTPQPTPVASGAQLAAEIVTRDLAVGPNSFSLGLLTEEQELVLGAQVHARFFQVVDDQQVFRGEGELEPVNITLTYTETHADGTVHTHEAGELGVYKANVEFDESGIWVVEVTATVNGKTYDPVTAAFEVREKTLTPAIGDPAPRSRQTILADVADITEIDTSDPPNPDM
ncbi:MAG: hypothetical protein ACE5IZ_11475, partial [Dehalococcoidia bacterium]